MTVEKVAFLASGWSLASSQAHGTSIALKTDEETILVDAGGQVSRGLASSFGTSRLENVYLTHEHPDHTYALPGLIHHLRFAGDRGPLHVRGPAPALERARRAIDALGVTCPFELRWDSLSVSDGSDERARWTPTEHSVPTLAYRFGDVVVCGDTSPSPDVVGLAKGASLLIHEATHPDEEKVHSTGHSTPTDAGGVAEKADVDALAMIHLHPEVSKDQARDEAGFEPVFLPVDGDILARSGDGWAYL